jgi:hypothetical protein
VLLQLMSLSSIRGPLAVSESESAEDLVFERCKRSPYRLMHLELDLSLA